MVDLLPIKFRTAGWPNLHHVIRGLIGISYLLAVIAYGLSCVYSLFLWRKGFRRHDFINYGLLLAGYGAPDHSHVDAGVEPQAMPGPQPLRGDYAAPPGHAGNAAGT